MLLLDVGPEQFSAMALSAPAGAQGLRMTPYFGGERTPNLPDAAGALEGVTLTSFRRENLARAAIEGMLGGLMYGMSAIQSLGVPAERVLLIGGAARSEAVRSIARELLPVPVVAPRPGEYVAWGAARQAAATVGASLPGAASLAAGEAR